MPNTNEIYDITIIGGGPAGMFAGFYAGLREAKTQLIESLMDLGGQVTALYPEKHVLDVGGYPDIKGRNLVGELEAQLKKVDTDVKLNATVTNIVPTADGCYQVTTNQEVTKTKAIIIATGVGAFNPRKLAVDNSAEFENTNLFYSIKDLQHFKNHIVLVAGGGDAAIDEALLLESVASKVYLLHRRNKLRAMEYGISLLNKSTVTQVIPYLISGLAKLPNDKVKLTANKVKSDEQISMTVDDIVVNYGFIAQTAALDGWQVKPAIERGNIPVNMSGQTNLANIFSIGDVATFPGKQPLIATAFGEAPMAVNTIMKNLYPDKRSPIHSTSIKKHPETDVN